MVLGLLSKGVARLAGAFVDVSGGLGADVDVALFKKMGQKMAP